MTTHDGSSAGPIDPRRIGTRAELSAQLTELRTRAGIPLRSLAVAVDTPASTISGWMTGKHLPNLRQIDLFRQVLAHLQVPDAETQAWVDALLRVRTAPGPRPTAAPTPYRGLARFEVDDSDWYFGRSALTDQVLTKLDAQLHDPHGPRMLVLVGSSGAGKSSLLRAGVAAAVERGRLGAGVRSVVLTPGVDPFGELSRHLTELSETTPEEMETALREHAAEVSGLVGGRVLVVIDQLEELFTLTADESERFRFIQMLLAISAGPKGLAVLVSLRSDFYGRLAQFHDYAPILEHHQIVVTSMGIDQLRQTITEPARRAGISVEDELVDLMVRDFAPRDASAGAHDAGALPLMSHALLETWKRSRRGEMTVAEYLAVGGLEGAVEQTAEAALLRLTPDQQELAQRLFLRLVNIDDEGVITRRQLPLDDLVSDDQTPEEQVAIDEVLRHFVDERLLTAHESTVELSHEALLTAWPRLRRWVESDRDGMRMLRQVHDATRVWADSDRDPNTLLIGSRLESLIDWASADRATGRLSAREREFLAASQDRKDRGVRAARRRRLVLQSLTAVSVVLAILAATAAVVAVRARDDAKAEHNRALSRKVALQAQRLAETDPSLAAQLALIAYQTSGTAAARSALLDASATGTPTRLLGAPGSTALATSADGRRMAVSNRADGTVQLFDLTSGDIPARVAVASLPGEPTELFALALSPDASLLAAGGANSTVALWDLSSGTPTLVQAALGEFEGGVQTLAFHPGGTELAAGAVGAEVLRWDLSHPGAPVALAAVPATGPAEAVPITKAVTYSPEGTSIAMGGDDGIVHLWDITGDEPRETATVAPGEGDQLHALAFSPDGTTLAGCYRSRTVTVWSVADGALTEVAKPESAFTTWVNTITFSPDGSTLAAGGSDSTIQSWRVGTWEGDREFQLPSPVTGLAFVDGGRSLASVSTDGTARVWPFTGSPLTGPRDNVFSLAFSADGTRMAVFPGDKDGTTELWDSTDITDPQPINLRIAMPETTGRQTGSGTLTPDGMTLVAGTSTGPAQVWDVTDGAAPEAIPTVLEGPTALIETVGVSNDGRYLAIGSDDATVHMWDMTTPTAPVALPTLADATNQILGVAFNADGTLFAAASADTMVYLWDYANPSAPVLLAALEGFGSYVQAVAFSDDGALLAAGSADKTVRVWDITDPTKPEQQGDALPGPQNYVFWVDFQPGTRVLAGGVTDGSTWLWDLEDPADPTIMATLNATSAAVFVVAFAPDGRHLVGSGSDRQVFVWDTDPESVASWICTRVGDPITEDEWNRYLPERPYEPPCSSE